MTGADPQPDLETLSAAELQKIVYDPSQPMKLRNRAAKRFKILQREAKRKIQARLEKHFN